MNRKLRIHHAKLNDDTYAQRHLIRRENFLAFDSQIALPHVHQYDLDVWLSAPKYPFAIVEFVTAGFEHFGENTVLIPQPAVSVLDDNLDFAHGLFLILKLDPGAWLIRS